jgi:hypothetical protein
MAPRTAAITHRVDRMAWISRMDKLLVSVSQAEQAIEACQGCSIYAAVPFSTVLHSFRAYRADQVEFILPVLARCSRCGGAVDESTLVKPKRQQGQSGRALK